MFLIIIFILIANHFVSLMRMLCKYLNVGTYLNNYSMKNNIKKYGEMCVMVLQ